MRCAGMACSQFTFSRNISALIETWTRSHPSQSSEAIGPRAAHIIGWGCEVCASGACACHRSMVDGRRVHRNCIGSSSVRVGHRSRLSHRVPEGSPNHLQTRGRSRSGWQTPTKSTLTLRRGHRVGTTRHVWLRALARDCSSATMLRGRFKGSGTATRHRGARALQASSVRSREVPPCAGCCSR